MALKETETKNVALQEIIASRLEDSMDLRLLSMLQSNFSQNGTPKLTDQKQLCIDIDENTPNTNL